MAANGDIYFTDPPYGLDKLNDTPFKQLPFNGVFRIAKDGAVSMVIKDLTFPNGIGLSSDHNPLYLRGHVPLPGE